MKEAKNNILSGICFLAFGIFVFAGSFWIPATTADILGSRFFPRVVAVLIGILSVFQIILNMPALKVKEEGREKEGLNKPLILTAAALFGYYVLVLYIGFTITSILYLLCQSAILMAKEDFKNKKKVVIMLASSILVPIAINAVFWNIFSIALPGGKLF